MKPEPTDKPKFCRDCLHYRPAWYGYGTRLSDDGCTSPQIEPDLVSGHGEMQPSMARSSDGYCGMEAKWFEPKVPKAPPVIPQPGGFKMVEPSERRPWWKIWGA